MGKLLSKPNSPTETKEENKVDQENVEKLGNEPPVDLNSVEKSEILQSVNKNRALPPGNRRRPTRVKTTPSSKSGASPSGENTDKRPNSEKPPKIPFIFSKVSENKEDESSTLLETEVQNENNNIEDGRENQEPKENDESVKEQNNDDSVCIIENNTNDLEDKSLSKQDNDEENSNKFFFSKENPDETTNVIQTIKTSIRRQLSRQTSGKGIKHAVKEIAEESKTKENIERKETAQLNKEEFKKQGNEEFDSIEETKINEVSKSDFVKDLKAKLSVGSKDTPIVNDERYVKVEMSNNDIENEVMAEMGNLDTDSNKENIDKNEKSNVIQKFKTSIRQKLSRQTSTSSGKDIQHMTEEKNEEGKTKDMKIAEMEAGATLPDKKKLNVIKSIKKSIRRKISSTAKPKECQIEDGKRSNLDRELDELSTVATHGSVDLSLTRCASEIEAEENMMKNSIQDPRLLKNEETNSKTDFLKDLNRKLSIKAIAAPYSEITDDDIPKDLVDDMDDTNFEDEITKLPDQQTKSVEGEMKKGKPNYDDKIEKMHEKKPVNGFRKGSGFFGQLKKLNVRKTFVRSISKSKTRRPEEAADTENRENPIRLYTIK